MDASSIGNLWILIANHKDFINALSTAGLSILSLFFMSVFNALDAKNKWVTPILTKLFLKYILEFPMIIRVSSQMNRGL
jgi:hypothetical protein